MPDTWLTVNPLPGVRHGSFVRYLYTDELKPRLIDSALLAGYSASLFNYTTQTSLFGKRERIPLIDFAETLEQLRSRLPLPGQNPIPDEAIPQAAVAIILREFAGNPELLVIQRAENPRDHWSGHLALPGGRASVADESLIATAAREVAEEVGIELSLDADFLGQLRSISPSNPRLPAIRVTPFVAIARAPFELRLSHEVGAAFWASVPDLRRTGRSDTMEFSLGESTFQWPAYPSEKGPIWGITERIITDFLSYLE